MFFQTCLILILIIFKILKNHFAINLEFSTLFLQLNRKKNKNSMQKMKICHYYQNISSQYSKNISMILFVKVKLK